MGGSGRAAIGAFHQVSVSSGPGTTAEDWWSEGRNSQPCPRTPGTRRHCRAPRGARCDLRIARFPRFAGFHGHVAGWFRRGPSLRSPTPASNASPPTPQASTRRCASLSAAQGHWPVNAQGQFTDAPQSRPPQTRPARSVFQEPRIQGPPSEAATTAVSSRVLSTPTHRATLRRRLFPGLQTESS